MASATVTEVESKTIPIFVMGKQYEVPETLTIMKAMEYAGYKYIRGCGCRGGVCGACATVYRTAGDYKIRTGLACQTVVEPDMYLAQLPFYPALHGKYDFKEAEPVGETVQFERLGYFCADPDSELGRPVFDRTVTLKDAWAKLQKQGKPK